MNDPNSPSYPHPRGSDPEPPAAVPGPAHCSELADTAVRLEELVTKCVTFLQTQLQRLEDAYVELQGLLDEPQPAQQRDDELSEQQAAWEQHCAKEADRIEEQLVYLTEAWNVLENEQRQQLSQDHTVLAPAQGQPAAPAQPAASQLDLVETPNQQSSTSAAIQFQKLKREIRQHSRRNR